MTALATTWCVIPVKPFALGKSRLSTKLSARARSDLSRSMFGHVLAVCTGHRRVAGVLVVTDDTEIASVAQSLGAHAVSDGAGGTLGLVVDHALQQLAAKGARDAVVVMSDLPQLIASDLDALIDRLSTHDLVIAPDRHRQGTNALGLRVGVVTHTCFGRADSFQAHLSSAATAGLRVSIVDTPTLGLDVDTPDDYARLFP